MPTMLGPGVDGDAGTGAQDIGRLFASHLLDKGAKLVSGLFNLPVEHDKIPAFAFIPVNFSDAVDHPFVTANLLQHHILPIREGNDGAAAPKGPLQRRQWNQGGQNAWQISR